MQTGAATIISRIDRFFLTFTLGLENFVPDFLAFDSPDRQWSMWAFKAILDVDEKYLQTGQTFGIMASGRDLGFPNSSFFPRSALLFSKVWICLVGSCLFYTAWIGAPPLWYQIIRYYEMTQVADALIDLPFGHFTANQVLKCHNPLDIYP